MIPTIITWPLVISVLYLRTVTGNLSIGLKIEGHNNRYFQSDSYIVSEKGAAFTRMGTFEVIDPEKPAIIKTYDLTDIERALWHAKRLDDTFTLEIENSLNEIYRLCGKERRHFLPIFVSQIPEENVDFEIVKAHNHSLTFLQELENFKDKTFSDDFDVQKHYHEMERSAKFLESQKQSHKTPSSYEDAKKSLQFTFNLRKISEATVVIQVQMINPFPKRGELLRVVYIPVTNVESRGAKYLSDQGVDHIFKFKTEYMLVKNLTKCDYKDDIFYCDHNNVQVVSSFSYDCLIGILKSNKADCGYEESHLNFKKYVHLGSDKFYFIQPRETNYVYECKYVVQKGVLHGTGVFTVDENCKLTTDSYSIFNNGGLLEDVTVQRKYNEHRVPMLGFSFFILSTSVLVLSMLSVCVISMCKVFMKPKYSVLYV
ncbi:hypothetical protein ACFFRR_006641 [Megaselia abdita]